MTDKPPVTGVATPRIQGLLCPVCRVDLALADRQGIEIDYCPQCRGIWLDRGELDKIIERNAAYEASAATSQGGDVGYAAPAPGYGQPSPCRDDNGHHDQGRHGGGHGRDRRHGGGHHDENRRGGFLAGLFRH